VVFFFSSLIGSLSFLFVLVCKSAIGSLWYLRALVMCFPVLRMEILIASLIANDGGGRQIPFTVGR
jgi:hypothetical protein